MADSRSDYKSLPATQAVTVLTLTARWHAGVDQLRMTESARAGPRGPAPGPDYFGVTAELVRLLFPGGAARRHANVAAGLPGQ